MTLVRKQSLAWTLSASTFFQSAGPFHLEAELHIHRRAALAPGIDALRWQSLQRRGMARGLVFCSGVLDGSEVGSSLGGLSDEGACDDGDSASCSVLDGS